MQLNVNQIDFFKDRHNGPSKADQEAMLATIGVKSLDELILRRTKCIRITSVWDITTPIHQL